MSQSIAFCLCLDCWEFTYAPTDTAGVFSRGDASWNHDGHSVHVFGKPIDYPQPIKNVLTCIAAGLPISDARMEMFSLACAVSAVQPTNGVRPAMTKTAAQVSNKVPDEPQQDDLFGGAE